MQAMTRERTNCDTLVRQAHYIHLYLMRTVPLLASFLSPVKGCIDEEGAYAAVEPDGTWYVTPRLMELPKNEWVTVVAHEALHRLLEHHKRGAAAQKVLNAPTEVILIAADVVVNTLLSWMGFSIPKNAITSDKVAKMLGVPSHVLEGLSFEAIIKLILDKTRGRQLPLPLLPSEAEIDYWEKEMEEASNSNTPGNKRRLDENELEKEIKEAEEHGSSATEKLKREIEKLTEEGKAKLREAATRAAEIEKRAGIGKGAAQLVLELLEPEIDWREIFRSIIGEWKRRWRTTTYTRVNKKNIGGGILRRGRKWRGLPPVIAIVDVSGSMLEELDVVFSELEALSKLTDVTVITFDYGVKDVLQHYRGGVKAVEGGGGTLIGPALEMASQIAKPGSLTIVMSDFYLADTEEDLEKKLAAVPGYKVFVKVGEGDYPELLEEYGRVITVSKR